MSQNRILAVNKAELTSREIAEMLGYTARYVRKVRARLDLPRPGRGGQHGAGNGAWIAGRSIDLDGYATVPTPSWTAGRSVGRVLEHRLVMESVLGIGLGANDVVDHIDGLTLHNSVSNLRVFASNGDHLRETLAGRPKQISASGRDRIRERVGPRVDIHRQRKERGDVRLHQVLLAALQFGIDSPHLLGTQQWLEKAGIDGSSRSSLRRALDDLYRRYEADLLR